MVVEVRALMVVMVRALVVVEETVLGVVIVEETVLGVVVVRALMVFIGINIAMGIKSLPSLNNFWSTDPILAHSCPFLPILGSVLSCLVIGLGRF